MRYFVFLLALFTVATGRPQQSLAGSASFSGSAAISSTPVVWGGTPGRRPSTLQPART